MGPTASGKTSVAPKLVEQLKTGYIAMDLVYNYIQQTLFDGYSIIYSVMNEPETYHKEITRRLTSDKRNEIENKEKNGRHTDKTTGS